MQPAADRPFSLFVLSFSLFLYFMSCILVLSLIPWVMLSQSGA